MLTGEGNGANENYVQKKCKKLQQRSDTVEI